uniref:Coilin N-terminal domain-containing protein n=1 Tax=Solanum tuberosum TaxID=4113 RepID=M1CCU0_SOLTU
MERVRLRLTFEDPNILTDLQKSEGLRCSWFLLKPQLLNKTISDLSVHILRTFQLHSSCPHGLLLSMDGFLLPPFESTCILKDKCIVSVKKKGGVLANEGNDAPSIVENIRIVEKQPVNTGHLLLANKEFDNESGGYESEDEEGADPTKVSSSHLENSLGCNIISEKRKASQTLPGSKKKKHCSEVAEKVDEQTKKSQQGLTSKKSHCKQKKVADPDSKDVDNIKGSAESSKRCPISWSLLNILSVFYRSNEIQERGVENVEATTKPEKVKKGPSRSARKQYAKRQWLREMVKIYKNAASEAEGLLHWKKLREEDKGRDTNKQEQVNEKSTLCGKPGQQSDMEAEIVPDQAMQHDQVQEIAFPSIHEVSLVKNGNSDSVGGLPATNKSNPVLNAVEKKTSGPAIENGGVNLWEQHSETNKAEQEQSHKESSWGTWSSVKKSSWSARALKGSARGPTMAFRRYKR